MQNVVFQFHNCKWRIFNGVVLKNKRTVQYYSIDGRVLSEQSYSGFYIECQFYIDGSVKAERKI